MSEEQPVPSGFLARGRLDFALRRLGVELIGTSIGSYEITALLGVGGMGEVYRARDTKLGRDVAIKVLPAEFASDRDRLARFEREARVLASLNHPHIATIHGFEDASGMPALVMELVEGETLGERIARGPLPIGEALAIAQQIVEALDAAHEHGIIHRDLKPANVKRRPDGAVKVLDFGLAKATAESASQNHTTESGMILGTAPYMSPEQARGHRVDKRADIWAFGCVLYEMLTGVPAFQGATVSDTLAAVLDREPDWKALPASTPPFVRRVLAHCLEKDPRRRLRDIADVRYEFAEPAHATESVSIRRVPSRWRSAATGVGVAVAIVAAALAWRSSQQNRGPDAVTQFRLTLPSADLSKAVRERVSISRDGRFIVYSAVRDGIGQLYLHRLDDLDPIAIRGTEGHTESALISPDGEWVAYYDARTQSLKKIAIAGGTPSIIYKWPGTGFFDGADWGTDGTIVFTNQKTRGLMRMPADGSEAPAELTAPADEFHYLPHVHPGGGVVVFTIDRYSIRSTIAAMRLDGGPYTTLVEGSSPRVTSNGYLLFMRDGGIWAAKFDEQALRLTTPPTLVVGDLEWFADFDVAANGTLVYTPTESSRKPVWVDRQGKEEPLAVPPQTYQNPRVSPDGSRVILDVRDIRDEGDIWIFDQRRSNLSQLTAMNGNKRHAIWSRDGTRIYFSFVERPKLTEGPAARAPFFVYSQRVDGTGVAERVFESPDMAQYPMSFTADGSKLVLREMGARRGEDWNLRLLTLTGGRFDALLASDAYETNGEISPDGKWIAYESEESPRREVYVRPFPDVQAGRWLISTNGGREPLWSRSGSELFYLGPDGRLMKVDVKTTPTFSASTPARLLNNVYLFYSLSATAGRSYDVLPDGSRFLMIKDAAVAGELVVALNWARTLDK